MGNITETIVFENLEADREADMMDEDIRWEDGMMDVSVNPDFKDFDWDTPIKDQPWYTPSTEMDLDRDVPTYDDFDLDKYCEENPDFDEAMNGMPWEPEYLGDR